MTIIFSQRFGNIRFRSCDMTKEACNEYQYSMTMRRNQSLLSTLILVETVRRDQKQLKVSL